MISYETVRSHFKSLNITLIVVQAITILLSLISMWFTLLFLNNLNNPDLIANYQPGEVETLKANFSGFYFFVFFLDFAVSVIILISASINLRRLNSDIRFTYLPYYLGAAFSIISLATDIFNFSTGIIISIIIQIALLTLYFFAYKQAKTLNNSEEVTEMEV